MLSLQKSFVIKLDWMVGLSKRKKNKKKNSSSSRNLAKSQANSGSRLNTAVEFFLLLGTEEMSCN